MNFSFRSILTERFAAHRCFAAACLTLALCVPNPAAAERLLVQIMDYRVLVPTSQPCAEVQEVRLQAPDDAALLRLGEQAIASGLFTAVGAVVQVGCAVAETINLSAFTEAGGTVPLTFRGQIIRGAEGWQGQGEVHVATANAQVSQVTPSEESVASASVPPGPDRFLLESAFAETGLDASGFRLPGLIAALHLNRPDLIPDDRDTRHHVASVFLGVDRSCRRRDELGGAAAARYASSVFGPQDHPFGGVEQIFTGIIGAMQNMHDPLAMMEGLVGDMAFQTREGLLDGEVYAEAMGCRSLELDRMLQGMVRLFRARGDQRPGQADPVAVAMLWSPEMREYLGIPDPLAAQAERETQMRLDGARANCASRFSDPAFCGCLIGQLAQAELSAGEWVQLGERFDFRTLETTRLAAADAAVRACLPAEVKP